MAISDWRPEERPRERLLARGARALSDAELVTVADAQPMSREALELVAKEYLLAEAVIDRLSRLIDATLLHALLKGATIDLSDLAHAEAGATALSKLVANPDYQIGAEYDDRNESYRLVIRKSHHGNLQITYLDRDFLQSGDYAQIQKTAVVLQGLLGDGAYVRRKEQRCAVTEFKQALDWLLDEVKKGIGIQRYKGLGEMNPEQLWETTMDPKVRRLMKVQIEDVISVDEIFITLMGDQVEPRRAFIETNALGARNLDV